MATFAFQLTTGVSIPFEDVEDVATGFAADSIGVNLRLQHVLEARDSYDCKGSSICKTLNVAACNRLSMT